MFIEAQAQALEIAAAKRLAWHRTMLLIRSFEEGILGLNRAGLVAGTAHLYIGMEAIATGVCAAMEEEDFLTSTHRGHGHALARGLDPGRMMAEILGRVDGYCSGKGGSMHITDVSKGMLGSDGIVGGGLPIAVGAALAARLRKQSTVTFCFFGEGAANQGSFHEALNFAGVHKLPIVFVCENNLWALSAAFKETTAGVSVARRAAGYGFPGEAVDGNDVEAVFLAAKEARARACSGKGPTLLECLSYRHHGHSVFTRDEIRPADEIESWWDRDPIRHHRDKLLESGTSAAKLDRMQAEVRSRIDSAVEFAKSSPVPAQETAFEGVYA
jgi:acetoin:2,6-dichlorophenolindophenol oxidoreductase subunit alpha